MKDLMMFYGVTLSMRSTIKQKDAFYKSVEEKMHQAGIKIALQAKNTKLLNINNIIIGDLSKANTIVLAPYDTPLKAILPSFKYYPFNVSLNIKSEKMNLLLQFIIACLCFITIFFIMKDFMINNFYLQIFKIVISIFLIGTAYLSLKGSANKVNFRRSSCSVALLMQMVEKIKVEQVAYILIDQGTNSFEGYKLAKEMITNKQEIIILDAINGDDLLVIAYKNIKDIDNLKLKYSNDPNIIFKDYSDKNKAKSLIDLFEKAIILVNGKIIKKQLVVENTRSKKDLKVDMHKLEEISIMLTEYLGGKNE